jgi:high-affinity iron transporter
MRGFVNWSSNPSWLQVIAWVLYVGVVMTLFFRSSSKAREAAAAPAGVPMAPASVDATRS